MQTVTQEKLNVDIVKTDSPVPFQKAWQIESFCLKILEYGDYSLRKALAGKLSSHLRCTFFTAQNNSNVLAAAGSLYSVDNPAIAILGPVCTDPENRKKGLAYRICKIMHEHLRQQKIQAVYLGVKDNIPAVNLYKKLGFTQHSGIVMRRLFVSKDEFDRRYSKGQSVIIRRMDWRDFTEVSALLCEPAAMCSFDFCGKIFSSKYTEVQKFLPVFPSLMSCLENNVGFGFVLQTKENQNIVGTAFIKIQQSKMQNHVAILDFFVLDEFTDKGKKLVDETIVRSGLNGNRTILCFCPDCDIYKKQILISLGAEPYTVLPEFIRINNKLRDIIIYKLTRKL